jgi:hypothetical protein
MRFNVRGKWLSYGAMLLILILAVSSSQAATYKETFSGPLPSFFKLETHGEGVTATLTGGELVITIPAHASDSYYARILTTFNTGTAFQSQVDYNLVTWPEWYDWTLQAGLWATGGSMNAIRSQHNDYGWHEIVSASFHGNQYQKYVDGNQEGALRLTRNSALGCDGYYDIGSGWQPIGGYSPHTGDGPFVLQVITGSGAGAVEVHFDNFIITSANVHRDISPIEALLLFD